MVATRSKWRSYTVTVCRYIMFCAKTRPVPVAITDLGEMSPPMVSAATSRPSAAAGGAGSLGDGDGVAELADVDGVAELVDDGAVVVVAATAASGFGEVAVEQPARDRMRQTATPGSQRRRRTLSPGSPSASGSPSGRGSRRTRRRPGRSGTSPSPR